MDAIEMDAGELEAVSFSKEMTSLPMSGTGSRRSVLNGQSFKPRRARFRFDLSDSEAGGEQTLPERGRQASMSWQAASAAASSSSENAGGGNSFDAGKTTRELVRRAQLISGYDTVRYGLFTKDQISAGFAGTLGPEWTFVDAERLYEE